MQSVARRIREMDVIADYNCLFSLTANALISVASVTTNAPSPKIPQKSQRNREKATTPAISSDSDEHSGYVSDLADFWREYKRR